MAGNFPWDICHRYRSTVNVYDTLLIISFSLFSAMLNKSPLRTLEVFTPVPFFELPFVLRFAVTDISLRGLW
jgi:hypothetical protein